MHVEFERSEFIAPSIRQVTTSYALSSRLVLNLSLFLEGPACRQAGAWNLPVLTELQE
jgi:hypothetical protein